MAGFVPLSFLATICLLATGLAFAFLGATVDLPARFAIGFFAGGDFDTFGLLRCLPVTTLFTLGLTFAVGALLEGLFWSCRVVDFLEELPFSGFFAGFDGLPAAVLEPLLPLTKLPLLPLVGVSDAFDFGLETDFLVLLELFFFIKLFAL